MWNPFKKRPRVFLLSWHQRWHVCRVLRSPSGTCYVDLGDEIVILNDDGSCRDEGRRRWLHY